MPTDAITWFGGPSLGSTAGTLPIAQPPDAKGAMNMPFSDQESSDKTHADIDAQSLSRLQFDTEMDRIDALVIQVHRRHPQINEDFCGESMLSLRWIGCFREPHAI
jgi:hypothetical protein